MPSSGVVFRGAAPQLEDTAVVVQVRVGWLAGMRPGCTFMWVLPWGCSRPSPCCCRCFSRCHRQAIDPAQFLTLTRFTAVRTATSSPVSNFVFKIECWSGGFRPPSQIITGAFRCDEWARRHWAAAAGGRWGSLGSSIPSMPSQQLAIPGQHVWGHASVVRDDADGRKQCAARRLVGLRCVPGAQPCLHPQPHLTQRPTHTNTHTHTLAPSAVRACSLARLCHAPSARQLALLERLALWRRAGAWAGGSWRMQPACRGVPPPRCC